MLYREIPCPECNGWGYISDSNMNSVWSRQCTNCRGTGQIVVLMTNGEIIRTCNNEQLAKVYDNLSKWTIYSGGDHNRLLYSSIKEDFLVWLNKETDKLDMETIFDFIDKNDYEHPYLKVVNKN